MSIPVSLSAVEAVAEDSKKSGSRMWMRVGFFCNCFFLRQPQLFRTGCIKEEIRVTEEQQRIIKAFREAGLSYGAIAKRLEIPEATVKTFCRRSAISTVTVVAHCARCGIELTAQSGRHKKRFCSSKCRFAWWHAHRIAHAYTCAKCGAAFFSDNKRTYCSHACYIADRFKRRKEP